MQQDKQPEILQLINKLGIISIKTERNIDFTTAYSTENKDQIHQELKEPFDALIKSYGQDAIHKNWKVSFVKACQQDKNQTRIPDDLKEFFKCFDFFMTLNVDPFFYRCCLAKDDSSHNSDNSQASEVCNECNRPKEKKERKKRNFSDGFKEDGTLKERYKNSLFHLHGALHIRTDKIDDNVTAKKVRADKNNYLIDIIQKQPVDTDTTIFEAKSQDKLESINGNDYLKKQFETFKSIDCKNLVIYGASLNENDTHMWNAIRYNKKIKNIYVSYYSKLENEDANKKLFHDEKNKERKVRFFQSSDFDKLKDEIGKNLNSLATDLDKQKNLNSTIDETLLKDKKQKQKN